MPTGSAPGSDHEDASRLGPSLRTAGHRSTVTDDGSAPTDNPATISEAVALTSHRKRDGGAAVTDVGRPTLPDDGRRPGGDGWPPVVKHGITAAAVTLIAIFTESLELATLVGALLHGR